MLDHEEEIVRRLTEQFNCITSCAVQRQRRIWADVPREHLIEVLEFANGELGFTSLCTVTGLDLGDQVQLIYHLADGLGVVLNLKENAPKADPVFDTATNLYQGGMLYELEARNLLGITIRDIPEDIHYPLPDGWPEGQYPLRKDWTGTAEGEGMS